MFRGRSSLGGEKLLVDEVIECEVQLSPGGGEWAVLGDLDGHKRVDESETGGEDPTVGLGEQHGYAPPGVNW
jgi:hypothetical protein